MTANNPCEPYIQLSFKILENLQGLKEIQKERESILNKINKFKDLLSQYEAILNKFPVAKKEAFSYLFYCKVDGESQSNLINACRNLESLLELIKNCREHISFIEANCKAENIEKIRITEEVIRKTVDVPIDQTQAGIDNIKTQISILNRICREICKFKEVLSKYKEILDKFPAVKKEAFSYLFYCKVDGESQSNLIGACRNLESLLELIKKCREHISFIEANCKAGNIEKIRITEEVIRKTVDVPIDQTQAGIDNIKTQISILECAISDFKAEQERIIIEGERRRREEEERRRKEEKEALAKLHLNLLELIKKCREHISFIEANCKAGNIKKIRKAEEIIHKALDLPIDQTQAGIDNIKTQISILECAISDFKAEQERIRIEGERRRREKEERRRKAEEKAIAKLHLNLLELIKNCRELISFIEANCKAENIEKIRITEEVIILPNHINCVF